MSVLFSPRLTAVLWTGWAMLFLGALTIVWQYGSNVPLLDDWYSVPYIVGKSEVTLGWLWEQFGEHRAVLLRLVYVALPASFADVRAASYFQVLGHAALAAGLMLTAGRVRGRANLADLFFPLVLLHPGHQANFLVSSSLYIIPMTLAAVPLQLAMQYGTRLPRSAALVAGACLVLLPPCGAWGVILAPLLAVWLAWAGWTSWPEEGRRSAALLMLIAAGLGFVMCGLYFVGYEKPTWAPPNPGLEPSLRTALQFTGLMLGSVAPKTWPHSSLIVVSVLLLCTGLLLWQLVRGSAGERGRLLALLCMFVSMAGWILGMGWGRSSAEDANAGFADRLVSLASLIACPLYFVTLLCGPPRLRAVTPSMLAVSFLALLPFNTWEGLKGARGMRELLGGIERDLDEGLDSWNFVKYHAPNIFYESCEFVAELLPYLRDGGFGAFVNLGDDPPMSEVRLPANPTALHQATWKDSVVREFSKGSRIVFTLPAPRFAWKVRIPLTYLAAPNEFCTIHVVYRRSLADHPGEKEEVRAERILQGGKEQDVTLWVGESITEVRLEPENAKGHLRVGRIVLSIPAEGKK